MKLLDLVESLILEQHQLEKLKEKYVGEPIEGETHKRFTEKEFQDILDLTRGKFNLTAWLTIRISHGLIQPTDMVNFKEYFEIFEKNKNKFELKDLNQYKTKEQIEDFIKKCVEIRERNSELTSGIEDELKSNYVSPKDIEKLESAGIHFLGMSGGYQVFEIPNEIKDNENSWKVYRSILGRCGRQGENEGVNLCTIANMNSFKKYLSDYPGSSYFVIFNMIDYLSPFQIHFESDQFKDRENNDVL
jgi:hypothetical protein